MCYSDWQTHPYAIVSCKECRRAVAFDGQVRICPHCKTTPFRYTSFQVTAKKPAPQPNPIHLMGG